MDPRDRRRFPRLKTPVLCRPAGLRLRGNGMTVDVGLGGARVFSDDEPTRGALLELELILPDGHSVVCKAVVAWSEALPADAPARYDVGLQFTDVSDEDRQRLAGVLETSS